MAWTRTTGIEHWQTDDAAGDFRFCSMDNVIPAPRSATAEPLCPVGSHVARALEELWRAYRRQLKRCQKKFSSKTIHQLRVRTRRLLANLDLIRPLLSSRAVFKVRRTLRRRLKALGELRDVQVQSAFLVGDLDHFPGLPRFRSFLLARERRLKRLARRKVGRWHVGKLGRRISGIRDDLTRCGASRARQAVWRNALQRGLDQAFAEIRRRRKSIDPADLETIHRIRIAFKHFRYMVESMPPELRGRVRATGAELAGHQRKMGGIQDTEVLLDRVEAYCIRHPGERKKLRRFRRSLARRRDRLVQGFVKSANVLESLWQPTAVVTDTEM